MIIANGFNEIYETLDFTDSIVEGIAWENHLLDLVLTIDYYFSDDENNVLRIKFKDCLKAEFMLTDNLFTVSEEEKHAYSMSWYTIQNYKLINDSELLKKYGRPDLIHFEIYTVDHKTPWLSVISRGVTVEKINV